MAALSDLLPFGRPPSARGRVNEREDARDGGVVSDADARARLSRLYRLHAGRVQRFLRDVLRDDALAWDATQETFARAFARDDILSDTERAAPWLFGVARNVSMELRRAQSRSARYVERAESEVERVASCADDPEATCLGKEAIRVIDAALTRLSEDRRAVLLLRLDHGLAYEEIAELMNWSLAKTKVEIFRAREVLRGVMAEYERGSTR